MRSIRVLEREVRNLVGGKVKRRGGGDVGAIWGEVVEVEGEKGGGGGAPPELRLVEIGIMN